MNVFDQVLLGVLGLSVAVGLWRGLISEIFALLGWLLALFVAWQFAGLGASWLVEWVETDWLRWPVAFAVIFFSLMLVLALLRFLLRELISISGLSVLDRLAGACFGALRALVLAVLFVAVAGMSSLPEKTWWQASTLAPLLEVVVVAGRPLLPKDLADRIKYEDR